MTYADIETWSTGRDRLTGMYMYRDTGIIFTTVHVTSTSPYHRRNSQQILYCTAIHDFSITNTTCAYFAIKDELQNIRVLRISSNMREFVTE